jgi:UDPglucose--hexose-1-phosphate uridylyltransferase
VIPKRVMEEVDASREFYDGRSAASSATSSAQESSAGVRLVSETDRFTVLAPYAPRFPFETWILPKQHASHFEDSEPATAAEPGLGAALHHAQDRQGAGAAGLQLHRAQRAGSGSAAGHYHWHIEIIPKLTKVAGFEWGTGFYINPTPPEESAHFLREAGLG